MAYNFAFLPFPSKHVLPECEPSDIVRDCKTVEMDTTVNVVVHWMSGTESAPFTMRSSSLVSELRDAVAQSATDDCDTNAMLCLISHDGTVLEDTATLAQAGLQDGFRVTATRVATVEVFALTKWVSLDEGNTGGSALKIVKAMPGQAGEVAAAALRQCGALLSPAMTREDEFPKQLIAVGAGFEDANGLYLADQQSDLPQWRKVTESSAAENEFWICKGNDGNWCLDSNVSGQTSEDPKKRFYYVNRSPRVRGSDWQVATHGAEPPPVVHASTSMPSGACLLRLNRKSVTIVNATEEITLPDSPRQGMNRVGELAPPCPETVASSSAQERLFEAISGKNCYQPDPNLSAYVAAPILPNGWRPIVLHVMHCQNKTHIWTAMDDVCMESFEGYDDEQISRDSYGAQGDTFTYLGK